MRLPLLFVGCVTLLMSRTAVRGDSLVNSAEMSAKNQWVSQTLLSMDRPVVTFRYGGVPSSELLPGWRKAPIEVEQLPGGQTQYVMHWTDPKTGLELQVMAVDYGDYPAVEWTAYLTNHGTKATPIIEQVQGIDAKFGPAPADVVLRTTQGDNFSAASYEPLRFTLGCEAKSFQPVGGRPTNGAWPYFNVDEGQRGIILALGWPGQWQAQFARENGVVVTRGGQETTHLRLEPGETIRTPLVSLLFWTGENWIIGQNLWRHWFLAHSIPRPSGHLPPLASILVYPKLLSAAASDIGFFNTYLEHGFKFDYLWVDAGWYSTKRDWWSATGVGTWKPDPTRYPRGIREVSDYAHGKGMKFVLWFEPERVYRGSYLWDNHPDWLLHWSDSAHDDLRLLNLGNPAARQWLTDYIGRFITEQGIDVYRQDFNVDPLKAWQNNDRPDRQGMTENLYVQGYLAYWDALLRLHPGLMIDSCASGGRRNDLETLRRGVPLLRSDYQAPNLSGPDGAITTAVFDGNQGQTYGLSLWIPYYGSGVDADDEYSARSDLCPAMSVSTDMDDPDWPALRRQINDHLAVAKYFSGDYYPLTLYSESEKVWMAWEFVRPANGDGVIQAFRRENNAEVSIRLKLHALEPDAQYEFTDLDSGKTARANGSELMTEGLRLTAAAPRTALIVTFKKVP